MNLILHQFKTDMRHFRWWLMMLWLAFVMQAALMCSSSLPLVGKGILQVLVLKWEVAAGVVLIAALVQADALVGTSAAWMTRPIRRSHVFWAKSAFIVLLVLFPQLAAQSLTWLLHGYTMHLWLCAVGESLMFSAAFALVAAVLASMTRDLARFFLAIGIAAGGMFASAVLVEMLDRAGIIHRPGWEFRQRASFEASVLTMAFLVLVAGALAAWIAQARLRRLGVAITCFAVGWLAFPLIAAVWSFNFLQPRTVKAAPVTVSVQAEGPQTNTLPGQRLSTELVAYGVPDQDVAVVQDIKGSITFDEAQGRKFFVDPNLRPFSLNRQRPANSSQDDAYYRVIEKNFPAETLWFNDEVHHGRWMAFSGAANQFNNHPPTGLVDGAVELDLFAVKKVAEARLRPATFNTLPGQWVTIQSVKLIDNVVTVSISECAASLMWDRDMKTAGFFAPGYNRTPLCTYVLYHPGSGEALVVPQDNGGAVFPDTLTGAAELFFKLRFPYPALRERLAGMTAAEWMREARLCVFAPEYKGTAKCPFHEEHFQWKPSTSFK